MYTENDTRAVTAAVVRAAGAPFSIETARIRAPRGDEVLVRVVATGLCHTDLIVRDQYYPVPLPAVLGHEGAGIVQEVGDGVTDVAAGDHVILSFVPACRQCPPCLRGQSYLCDHAMVVATSPHFTLDGNPIGGFTGVGTFAEELIISEHCLIKVDNDVPLDIVSLIGCGVTTGMGAVINSAQVTPGSRVVVVGVGRGRRAGSLLRLGGGGATR